MANLNFDCYAVIQRGYAVFGVGENEAEAWADADQWLDAGPFGEYEQERYEKIESRAIGKNHGDLALVPCTRALMEYVKANGTTTWASDGREDSGIGLPEEFGE